MLAFICSGVALAISSLADAVELYKTINFAMTPLQLAYLPLKQCPEAQIPRRIRASKHNLLLCKHKLYTMNIFRRSKTPESSTSTVGQGPLWSRSKFSVRQYSIILGSLLMVAGGVLLFASGGLDTSTDANTVIVQYSLPHMAMPINRSQLAVPMANPFTLYGNGLLVCGYGTDRNAFMPPMAGMTMHMLTGNDISAPTATTLSQPQIHDLMQKISNTGFFDLKHEYYKLPIVENQEMLRVSTLSTDQYVLYYQDVAAPAAYTAVISMLSSYCSTTTTPYVTSNNTLRVLKDADTTNKPVSNITNLQSAVQSTLGAALPQAAALHDSLVANPRQTNSISATSSYEKDQTIPADQAAAIASQSGGKLHQYVSQNGTNYEVGLDPQPPKISNPLTINYKQLRAQENNGGVGAKIKNILSPRAYASGTEPVRIVVLVPTDLGGYVNPALTSASNTLGPAVASWYCGQVSSCYNYTGVSVVQGSLSRAQYMTCPAGYGCTTSTGTSAQLSSIITNVYIHDPSVFAPNVDTLIVPDWATTDIGATGTCGLGFVGPLYNGGGLAITDLYLPTISSGTPLFCQTGHDIAHELGHTFGLNHTGNGTLMDGTPYTQYASFCDINDSLEPTCTLDPGQAAALTTDWPFFSPPPTAPPPTPPPPPGYGDNVLQVTDQAAQPTSGVALNYTGGSATPTCRDGWGSGAVGTSTTDGNGQISVRCLFYGSSGVLQLTSLGTPGYSINPSSALRLGTPIPVNQGATGHYNGAAGIRVVNSTEGNSVIQVIDSSGNPLANAYISFSSIPPATNCSGAWNDTWKSGSVGYAYTNSSGEADIFCPLGTASTGSYQITGVSFPNTATYSKYVASPSSNLKMGSTVRVSGGTTLSYTGNAGITGVPGDYGDDIIQLTDQAGQPAVGVTVDFTGGASTYSCHGNWNGGPGYSATDQNGQISVRCSYTGSSGNLQITSVNTPGYSINSSSAIKVGGTVPVPAETTNHYYGTSGITVNNTTEGNSVIQVVDASGNPINNAYVTFNSIAPAQKCSGAWNSVWKSGGVGYAYTNSSGEADIFCPLGTASTGSYQITGVSFSSTTTYSKYVASPAGNLKVGSTITVSGGTTANYTGTARGITGALGDYGNDIIQLTDQAGQAAVGVTVDFSGGASTYNCQGGWGNGGAGYAKTDQNGEITVRCSYTGTSGNLQITSINTPGYSMSSSSAIKVGGTVPVPVETTNTYTGTSGIGVISQSEGNSVIQIVDSNGNPISNAYLTFSGVSPTTNCSGAWNSQWHSGSTGYAYTNSNGQADIYCAMNGASSGSYQITAVNGLPTNYVVTSTSNLKVSSNVAIHAGNTTTYAGASAGITVVNPTAPIPPTPANIVIKVTDNKGNIVKGEPIQYSPTDYGYGNNSVTNCHDDAANDPQSGGLLTATTNTQGQVQLTCTLTSEITNFSFSYRQGLNVGYSPGNATLTAATTTTDNLTLYVLPAVTITAPTSEYPSGTVPITASVSPNGGSPISYVTFSGQCGSRGTGYTNYNLGTDYSYPYTAQWNTAGVNPNDCEILATAFNANGLSYTASNAIYPNCTLVQASSYAIQTASYIRLARTSGGGGSGGSSSTIKCSDGNTY